MRLHGSHLPHIVGVALLLAAQTSWASNGDQMVGYSGLSNGMAGAVVATPQDGTTALTNPAGLTSLRMAENSIRFDMNLGLFNPGRELNGVVSDNTMYVMAIGGLVFRTETLGDRVTFAVGAYPVSGGGVDFAREAFSVPTPGGPVQMSIVGGRQSLRIGPSVAYRVTDGLSLGLNLSLAASSLSLKGPFGNFPSDIAYGWSAVLGANWQILPALRVGATYTTRTRSQDLEWNTDGGRFSLSFEDPQSYALGVSYQIGTKFLIEGDVKYLDFAGVRENVTLNSPEGQPDVQLAMGWDSQWVYAIGAKVELFSGMHLIAGYNYGKSPIDENDVRANVCAMAIIEHHASFGAEVDLSEHSTLGLSLIRGFENQMKAPEPGPVVDVAFGANLLTLQFTYRG